MRSLSLSLSLSLLHQSTERSELQDSAYQRKMGEMTLKQSNHRNPGRVKYKPLRSDSLLVPWYSQYPIMPVVKTLGLMMLNILCTFLSQRFDEVRAAGWRPEEARKQDSRNLL